MHTQAWHHLNCDWLSGPCSLQSTFSLASTTGVAFMHSKERELSKAKAPFIPLKIEHYAKCLDIRVLTLTGPP